MWARRFFAQVAGVLNRSPIQAFEDMVQDDKDCAECARLGIFVADRRFKHSRT